MPSLQPGLAESRQFGGCFVLGVQVASALRDLYGRNGAETISGLCGTRVVLAAPDRDTAQWSADSLGRSEIEEVSENVSYGANTIRDGVSLTPRRELRALALPADIMRLPNLHGYLKFPGPYPVASIRLKPVGRPVLAPRFVPREDREPPASDRRDLPPSAEPPADSAPMHRCRTFPKSRPGKVSWTSVGASQRPEESAATAATATSDAGNGVEQEPAPTRGGFGVSSQVAPCRPRLRRRPARRPHRVPKSPRRPRRAIGSDVLSIGAIASAAQGASYYQKDGDYAKDDPEHRDASAWFGKGAEALGLTGPVDPDTFRAILEGKVPDGSGTELGKRGRDGEITHRPGRDLTFSAPKSVSIAALVGGDERIVGVHDRAVKKPRSPGSRRTPSRPGCGTPRPAAWSGPAARRPWSRPSATAPRATSIRSSTRTRCWPTWSRARTASGGPWPTRDCTSARN